jgi:hypothetical protein
MQIKDLIKLTKLVKLKCFNLATRTKLKILSKEGYQIILPNELNQKINKLSNLRIKVKIKLYSQELIQDK